MSASLSSYTRFHATRLLRLQPAILLPLVCAIVFLLVAATVCLYQWRAAHDAREKWEELQGNGKKDLAAERLKTAQQAPGIELPKFHSGKLISAVNQLAAGNKLAMDEVSYTLDESPGQPFMRYRITMTVTSSYPVIRRFSTRLSSQMPNMVLDTITCSREDIAVAALTCDLAFSAFFQRGGRG